MKIARCTACNGPYLCKCNTPYTIVERVKKLYGMGICVICSAGFEKGRPNQVYCSPKCRRDAWELEHPRLGVKPKQIVKKEEVVDIGVESDEQFLRRVNENR